MRHFLLCTFVFLCVSCRDKAPELQVHQILSDQSASLSTAESCTGGTLATRFTAIPGASVYFKGGIVAYNIETKRKLLDVDCALIGRHGVVSEQVARAMAEGSRKATGSNYAISTTGIAGPTGGTPENPVGTVWIAVATPDTTISLRFCGGKNRNDVITKASTAAIELLLKQLTEQ